MDEIGLVRLVRLDLEVSESALSLHRKQFSKRQFTQPQLLAVLCLMLCEGWTFREAEVRLCEHSELHSALRLRTIPITPRGMVSCCDWRKTMWRGG